MAAVDILDSASHFYDNTDSGLVANKTKLAIDELAGLTDANSIASTSWTAGTNTYRITSINGTNYDTVITDFSTLTLNSVSVATVDDATALAIALG